MIVGDDGNLYLVNDHAWRLTPQGQFTEVLRVTDIPKEVRWAFAVDAEGNIKGPQERFGRVNAAALGPDGSIYALDAEQRIRKIARDGTITTLAHSEEAAYAEGGQERRVRSMGLAIDADNNVYVANYWKRAVLKLSPDGRISAVLSSSWPWAPVGVTAAEGNIYVVERMSNPYGPSATLEASTLADRLGSPRIRKVSRDGTVTTLAVVKGERSLAVIVVPPSIVILAILIWRIRKRQLKRRSA
ncbi:MAG TPA: hypothetical protein VGQ39_01925 [Pyrinomonadaceae bacterium]|nr:hypothetical protein [Pyrinomonadaceae bacterium]